MTVYRYKNLLNDANIKAIDTLKALSDDVMSIVYKTLGMKRQEQYGKDYQTKSKIAPT